MNTITSWVISILALYELCKWDLEMAGIPPDLEPPTDESELKTVADLVIEIPWLRESHYAAFQRGVEFQVQGWNWEALQEYNKLRGIERSDGNVFDLAQVSNTLRHNLRKLGVESW